MSSLNFSWIGIMVVAATVIAASRNTRPEAKPERQVLQKRDAKRVCALFALLYSLGLLVLGVVVSVLFVWRQLIWETERFEPFLFVFIPLLFAGSAGLAWLGFWLMGTDVPWRSLPDRLAHSWRAAARAFHE